MAEENKDKPIPSAYSEELLNLLPDEMMDKVKEIVNSYGYDELLLMAHKKNLAGNCLWTGSSSMLSDCLVHNLEHMLEDMKEDLENKKEE